MFTVQTPASPTDLTLLATLKAEFGIASTSEDDYLNAAIKRASAAVCSYLRVPKAQDGTFTLGRETLVQTIRFNSNHRSGYRGPGNLILARRPVVSITSVVEGDETLVATDYELDGAAGLLARLCDDRASHWSCEKTVVTNVAGWLLPDKGADRTLPYDIESAVVDLIKQARAGRTRDPLIKAVEVVDIDRKEYWVGGIAQGGALPPDIASRLDPYRYPVLG